MVCNDYRHCHFDVPYAFLSLLLIDHAVRYHAFITDYDGTLAENNQVPAAVLQALKDLKATGRRLILVTGRQLNDLKNAFPEFGVFDAIVAENGALVFNPATLEQEIIGSPPPAGFFDLLAKSKIPYEKGQVIVSTWMPYERILLDAIQRSGLEHQVIFNKNAVMVLPPAVNKATGLHKALFALNISEHNAVAVGDAENDNAMLSAVECSIAVQNALPHVKQAADWTTTHPASDGVLELIGDLLHDDLVQIDRQLFRHFLQLGTEIDGLPFKVSPFGTNILIAGSSGSGKTTMTAAFLEKLCGNNYQFCLIDPEGDYLDLDGALTIGDSKQAPSIDEIIQVLTLPNENVVVCALAIPFKDRPVFFKTC
ncbi:MAG TPA: HAD-IIB family hydrolase [Mucilaginibacter sp.]|jgi:hydroxymethylpyrimidine pyrophosphatase-like HAD family hydrolase|nr:HAD-IIB family hydrolase [Mucilaginibacter sp.]